MSRDLPVAFIWRQVEVADDDGVVREVMAMVPLSRFANIAGKQFAEGEEHILVVDEPRNMAAHRAYFAQIKDAWDSLPESIAANFPSPEHLRKWALIEAGYCTEEVIDCSTEKAAKDLAKFARRRSAHARIKLRGQFLVIQEAISQSTHPKRGMRAPEFKASKEAVLDIIAGLIGVTKTTLKKEGGRNAG